MLEEIEELTMASDIVGVILLSMHWKGFVCLPSRYLSKYFIIKRTDDKVQCKM